MNPMTPLPSVKRSIFSEFMLLITIIIVTFSLLAGWYIFNSFNRLTQQQYITSLEHLAQEKSSIINQYIDDHAARIETLAMLPITQLALPEFSKVFQQSGIQSAAYDRTNLNYSPFFTRYLSHWNYYDIFFIDLQGNIVYSVKHESDFGSNLQTGAYRQTGLGQVFRQAMKLLQTNNSTFAYYEPSKEAGAFVATPVMQHGKLIGIVALQFDTDAFYHVINNLAGLGDSGEIVIGQVINDKILLTAPLRHDPDAAFKRVIALDADNASPIREGSQGASGAGIIIDWRGQEAVAVWQYIPALKWGMVVKIDTAEAFGYWQSIEKTLIAYVGLGLLITYILLFLFARRITLPLRTLTQASMDFGSGHHDVRVDALSQSNNEVGTLASAFGQMIQRVQASESQLQHTIEELAESNKILDQRVAEQTERIQAVIEHAADGIITMDEQGVIHSINPAISDMFAYSEAQIIGQNMSKLIPEIYDNETPKSLSIEVEGLLQSGETFPIDLRVNNMRVAGKSLFLATIRDITKRKKMEADQHRLAMAVEQTQDAILITDMHGVIEYANPAYEYLSGYSSNELVGQTPRIIQSGKMSESFYKNMWTTLLNGQIWHTEFINKHKSGELYEVDQAISPIFDKKDNMIGFVSVQRDITQANQERAKLEHTQRLESMGVLAGGIAHDFNNLLTAILGNASLAKGRIDSTSPAIKMIDNIENASERAAALCKQMLAYSGKGKFIVESINLTDMIEEMMNLLEVSIQKNVIMRLDLSDQLLPIEADASQMQQVIMNLVINASEAIDKKSGIITLHTGVVEIDQEYIKTTYMQDDIMPGRYVAIEVSDTGCGMDDETIKHIFDPFFTTKFTGRGLGMSAILGIVRGHKGAIKVYSEVGKGTTFKIIFPCSNIVEEQQKEIVKKAHTNKGYGTILIVDDEETIRATAGMMLEMVGFTIIGAKDGVEGVEVFKKHQSEIRAVLLDMTMPRMNGEEVFREIRTIQPDVKVILSSGYNEQDATNRFAGKGLAGFIQKPYSPDALQTMILDALGDDD